MGNWEKKVRQKLGKKVIVLCQTNLDGNGILSGDLGMEGKERVGEVREEVQ